MLLVDTKLSNYVSSRVCENSQFQFKGAGGFEALVSGKTTEMQKVDVNERIVGLGRLNPTPRPTT
jgi:hypothetical protein